MQGCLLSIGMRFASVRAVAMRRGKRILWRLGGSLPCKKVPADAQFHRDMQQEVKVSHIDVSHLFRVGLYLARTFSENRLCRVGLRRKNAASQGALKE